MKQFNIYPIVIFATILVLLGCTEAYELKTQNFESLLVVEATITNELKHQEIILSRTYRLESDEPNYEAGAAVWVEDNNQIRYEFTDSGEGLYTSNNEFQALAGNSYTLHIVTADNEPYASTPEATPAVTEIESLETALQMVNGEQGIQVYVNSKSNVGDAQFFKYDYEETYKVVIPFYNYLNLKLSNVDFDTDGLGILTFDLLKVPKPENVSICYSTKNSNEIIQTSLTDSQNSSVVRFPVRFINNDNGIIRDRYSILVKQYVQSVEAYNFYKILKELGTIENLFTDNQPGFIQGNMISESNAEENVIGFFQVSTVSIERIYFNYTDFGLRQPPYIFDCKFNVDLDYRDNTAEDGDQNDRQLMFGLLSGSTYIYYSGEFPIFTLVSIECGDCSSFSSTVIPEFWEE